jgi:hypothetical protein
MSRRFIPSVAVLEPRAMLDGDSTGDIGDGYDLAAAPPPEIDPTPPGGVLGGPVVGPSAGDPTAYDPTLTPGLPTSDVITPPPAPEGDMSFDGVAVPPIYIAPHGAFE